MFAVLVGNPVTGLVILLLVITNGFSIVYSAIPKYIVVSGQTEWEPGAAQVPGPRGSALHSVRAAGLELQA